MCGLRDAAPLQLIFGADQGGSIQVATTERAYVHDSPQRLRTIKVLAIDALVSRLSRHLVEPRTECLTCLKRCRYRAA